MQEKSNVTVLKIFLVKRSVQWKQRFFSNISFELWDQIGDDDDEEMMKGKVIDFLNPYHVVKNGKEFFFEFHVSKDQSSVIEKWKFAFQQHANF